LCPAAQTTLRGFKIIIESKFNYEFVKKKKKAQENDTKQISKTTKNKNKN
jgi:hypothetical protein